MTLQDIARALSARIIGDDSLTIERIVHPADAVGPADLAVAISDEGFAALTGCKAQAAVISAKSSPPVDCFKGIIVADGQRQSLAILTQLFDSGPAHLPGIHSTAVVAADAVLAEGVSIGPFVVVGSRSRIGANTVILAHVTIGADVSVGAEGLFHAGVRIGDRAEIGDRVVIHSNVVIGSDGFSFVPGGLDNATAAVAYPQRIHSLGKVIIEDDVEVGAGSTIDRATISVTRIGRGTKIDNLVQIAHNVTIGEGCLVCGMVGISGSVKIGDSVLLGGRVGIADHVTVGSGAIIAAGSGVGTNVPANTRVSGYPAIKHERSLENFLYLGRQKALHAKVGDLQSRIEALEQGQKGEKP